MKVTHLEKRRKRLPALAFGLLLSGVVAASTRMRMPRDPDKEGEQDAEAVLAYNLTSGWLPFRVVRCQVVHELAKYHPAGRLLDAGCGPGHLAILLASRFTGLNVSGLDNNPDMIAAAKQNAASFSGVDVSFQRGDVHGLPYNDGWFDFVVSTLSLHHWNEAGKALGELCRVLKPGGWLLLLDLRRDCPRWFYYGLGLIQRFAVPEAIRRTNGALGSVHSSYTTGELAGLLRSVPFREARVSPSPGWMLASARKDGEIPL